MEGTPVPEFPPHTWCQKWDGGSPRGPPSHTWTAGYGGGSGVCEGLRESGRSRIHTVRIQVNHIGKTIEEILYRFDVGQKK